MRQLQRSIWIPRPRAEVFEFFAEARNLERLTPPWMKFRILKTGEGRIHEGAQIEYALRVHGVPLRWRTLIERWNPPVEFVDVQLQGPYKIWRHTHRFTEIKGGTQVDDTVEYELPFGPLGALVHRLQVQRDLRTIFDYRAEQISRIFAPE